MLEDVRAIVEEVGLDIRIARVWGRGGSSLLFRSKESRCSSKISIAQPLRSEDHVEITPNRVNGWVS